MIFARQPLGELRQIRVQNLEATPLELLERLFTAHQPQLSTPLRTRLGENQCAVRKIERRESDLAGHLGSGRYPTETTRNHKMNNEKKIVLQLQDNALPHSPHTDNTLPGCRADWRIDRAKEERLGDSHSPEWLSHQSRSEGLHVNRYIRQLRHF